MPNLNIYFEITTDSMTARKLKALFGKRLCCFGHTFRGDWFEVATHRDDEAAAKDYLACVQDEVSRIVPLSAFSAIVLCAAGEGSLRSRQLDLPWQEST